jgi:hypothetical protein
MKTRGTFICLVNMFCAIAIAPASTSQLRATMPQDRCDVAAPHRPRAMQPPDCASPCHTTFEQYSDSDNIRSLETGPSSLLVSSVTEHNTAKGQMAANKALLLSVSLSSLSVAALGQVQASRAYDFVQSVGVNTHFSYSDSAYYLQSAKTIAAIKTLGVQHVRDGLAYGWVAPNLYAIYGQLAQAGIHPELVMPNPKGGSPSYAQIEALLPNYPGVEAIEAPNEFDQSGDANWVSDLRGYLPTLDLVSQDTRLPVIGPSLTQPASYTAVGNIASCMKWNNLHAYWGGRNSETGGWGGPDAQGNYYGSLPYDFDLLAIDGPGVPVVMTESGYVVNNTPKQNIIPESVEAVYEPRLLLHAWNKGVVRTYVYELIDEPSSTTGFGLMRSDLTVRPAYTALANLMSLLNDTSTAFSPAKLTYSLTGTTTGVETTLLQKQDGSFWVALWLKGSIWDVNLVKSTPLTPQQVTLSVVGGPKVQSISTFDGTGNAQTATLGSATVNLSVTSGVSLLKIK